MAIYHLEAKMVSRGAGRSAVAASAYMAPSQAEKCGYERVSKYPKSTKYGRQNPISARWNSEEHLLVWREAWATAANRCLELAGHAERIDHRSHAARGWRNGPPSTRAWRLRRWSGAASSPTAAS